MVGVTEDRIAALDRGWSEFALAERAAFALARKLTVAPQTISDSDIDKVRRHDTDLQVLEMIGLVEAFNAMNHWTGPLRLTQEDVRVFLKSSTPSLPGSRRRPITPGTRWPGSFLPGQTTPGGGLCPKIEFNRGSMTHGGR